MDRQELERVLIGFLEDKRKPQVKEQLMIAPTQKHQSVPHRSISF